MPMSLTAGADMALICNDPEAVQQTLESIGPLESPAGQARLVSLRPHPMPWQEQPLKDSEQWQQAMARLEAAQQPPPFSLDG